MFTFKGELNPKIKSVLFERTLSVSLICKLQIWRSIRGMTYRRMLYIFAIIKRNHFEVIMSVCFSHDTKHVHFEVISFYNSKDITFSDMSLRVRKPRKKDWKGLWESLTRELWRPIFIISKVLSNKRVSFKPNFSLHYTL